MTETLDLKEREFKYFLLTKYFRSIMRIISLKADTSNRRNVNLTGWKITIKELKRVMASVSGSLCLERWKLGFEGIQFPTNVSFKLEKLEIYQSEFKDWLKSIEALFKAISIWGLRDSLMRINLIGLGVSREEVIKIIHKYQEEAEDWKLFNAEISFRKTIE